MRIFLLKTNFFINLYREKCRKEVLHPYCLFTLFKKFLKEGMKKCPSH